MKIYYLSILFFIALINAYGQNPIKLTFKGLDAETNISLPLDSIFINNLNQNCDTTIYSPFSQLTVNAGWPVGINELKANSKGEFVLNQNFPNPFYSSTNVTVYRDYSGTLNLILLDCFGNILAEYHDEFEEGLNSFTISSSGTRILILEVFDNKNKQSIKLICNGQDQASNTIQYVKYNDSKKRNRLKNLEIPGFKFTIGNQMGYTAYSNGYTNQTINGNPKEDTEYIFKMAKDSGLKYLPSFILLSITPVSDTEITLAATIDNGKDSTVWSVEYGLTDALGSTASGGTITTTTTITKALTGLLAYTRYYWRIKAINSKGTSYSTIQYGATSTDFGFLTNQAGSNVNLIINTLNISAGKTVNINWGDGTNADYTGNNTNITKTYSTLGQFIVKFTGDINSITSFTHKDQSRTYGDLSNIPLPASLTRFEIYTCANITGDFSKWTLPAGLTGFYFGNNAKATGNPFLNRFPVGLITVNINDSRLSGDLSSVLIPAQTGGTAYQFIAYNTNFTGLFRGNFKNIGTFNFQRSNCSIGELDRFLAYVDNFFTGGVVPAVNAVYTLNGDGMDMPTGGLSNANLLSIASKYAAAGKTFSISINNYTIAFIDHATKVQVPLTTYIGGDNETVHPGVINIGYEWNGYQYWMANTPMPQEKENPSIWASTDGLNWVIPNGVINPIIAKPSGASSFNADTDLYFENNTLYMVFKQHKNGSSITILISSTDGRTWTPPVTIADPSDGQGDISEQISPSLIKIGSTYYLYYISMDVENYHIRRRSCLTVDGNYSNAEDIVLTKLAGRGFWHLSTRLIGSTVWIAVNVTTVDNTNTYGPYIVLAKSSDGITFTRDSDLLPTMCVTEKWENASGLYRPCFMCVGDQLILYYSYRTTANKWAIARVNLYLI